MFSNIGLPGILLIGIFALIFFGPSKLPELGKAVGKTLKEFKSATKELTSDLATPSNPIPLDDVKPVAGLDPLQKTTPVDHVS